MRITIAAAFAISLALTGGCRTYQASRGVAKAGGVILVAGAALVAIAVAAYAYDEDQDGSTSQAAVYTYGFGGIIGAQTVAVGAVVGSTGLIGMATHDKGAKEKEEQARARDEAAAVAKNQRTVGAWRTAKEAIAAAQADDCEVARKLGLQVLALDSEVHATVFVPDPAIKRCLAPPPPAPDPVQP